MGRRYNMPEGVNIEDASLRELINALANLERQIGAIGVLDTLKRKGHFRIVKDISLIQSNDRMESQKETLSKREKELKARIKDLLDNQTQSVL